MKESPLLDALFDKKGAPKNHFSALINRLSKRKEKPYQRSITSGFTLCNTYGDYTLEEIQEVRRTGNAQAAREISRFFYNTNTSYARIIDHLAYLPKYYYVLDFKNLSLSTKNDKKNLHLFQQSLNLLDNIKIAQTFGDISKKVLVEGVYYGYVTTADNGLFSLTQLDPSYCRVRNKSMYGTDVVEFNIEYLMLYEDEDDLRATLNAMPPEVRKRWDLVANGVPADTWVSLAPDRACAFTFATSFDEAFPRFFDSVLDILNYEDYKAIEKEKDSNELKKLLVQRFKLDSDGDLTALMEEMAGMHEAVANLLSNHDEIEVITSIADAIELKDTQKTGQVSQNNIYKMLLPKYEGAGVSYELFGSSTATAVERNLMNSTSFMSQLLEKYSTWLSLYIYRQLEFGPIVPIVSFLPINWYNEDKMVGEYIKNAQYGYSWTLPHVASGKKQSTLLDTTIIEQELLGLKEKMVPLSSTYTESSVDSAKAESDNESGRPALEVEEKTEKTLKNADA